ncbi:MAG: adenosylmethionine--8-amino-7-oxononanoate transaminase [Cytophagales bacterium]|nr:adenosylmethionine--8-amino-7-oxononanoate transaminase [Cytophagales bacterium]
MGRLLFFPRTGMDKLRLDTQTALAEDEAHIWHPFTPLKGGSPPLFVKGAEGIYLHTADGRRIIDATSSWWVNLHGHRHPLMQKALRKQLSDMEHVIFAGVTHAPAICLARELLKCFPTGYEKVFFSDDGSTSVEVALKLAFQYGYNLAKPKNKVIALEGAYHGDTFGCMAVGARGLFNEPFQTHFFEVKYLPFPNPKNQKDVLGNLDHLLATQDIAAFIYEPLVQGVSGMRMYDARFLAEILYRVRAAGVLCLADEVFTGFSRTGHLWASDAVEIKPDLICLSKGLTGGVLPLGATICHQRVVDAFREETLEKTFFHGHSYTGNPMACAAGCASLEILQKPETQTHIQEIAQEHQNFIHQLKKQNLGIQNPRALGTILAFDLPNIPSRYGGKFQEQVHHFFLSRNILLRPLGNTLYIVPPYVIKKNQLWEIYEGLIAFLESFSSKNL